MLTTGGSADLDTEPRDARSSGPFRSFTAGVVVAVAAVALVCAVALPRSAEIQALGDAVLTGGVAVAVAGAAASAFRRVRWVGLGLLAGAALGLALAWALMVLYVGLLMR